MDSHDDRHPTPWYLLPITTLWRIVSALEKRIGIVRSILIGVGLMLLGVVFCLTFVGILIGIPTFFFGLFLTVRGIC